MTRLPVLLLALLITAAPLSEAAAQDRGPRGDRQFQQDGGGARISKSEAHRIVEQRQSRGRFLSATDRGPYVVVRWIYEGGDVVDFIVDARTGQFLGRDR